MYTCQYCKKTFSNKGGLGSHQPYCKSNPQKIKRYRSPKAGVKKGYKPWNAGLTGIQIAWNKGMRGLKGTPHTEESKKHLSNIAKRRKLGGYVRGSGRGKKGWYKGFFCDSSWELAFVVYHLDHNIPISRNTEKIKYEWNGKIKTYIPDFIINHSQLIEIKGYKSPQWEAKQLAAPHVKTLYQKDLSDIFEYVIAKYGKNFVSLYGSDPAG